MLTFSQFILLGIIILFLLIFGIFIHLSQGAKEGLYLITNIKYKDDDVTSENAYY